MLRGAGVVPLRPARTSLCHGAPLSEPDENPPVRFPKRPSPQPTRVLAFTLE